MSIVPIGINPVQCRLPQKINRPENVVSFSGRTDFDRTLDQIAREIKKADSIAIMTHRNPDGDAIGSSAALANLIKSYCKLNRLQKDVDVYIVNKLPDGFKCVEDSKDFIYITPDNKKQYEDKKYDLAIAVDCAVKSFLTTAGDIFNKADKKIRIDHHPSSEDFGDISLVDEKASAASQIIYMLADKMNVPVNKNMAEGIFLGMVTDTEGLRHLKRPVKDFTMCAKLSRTGVDPGKIYSSALNYKTREMFDYYVQTLNNVKFTDDGRIAYITENSPPPDDGEDRNSNLMGVTNNVLANLEGVKIAMRLIRGEPTEEDPNSEFVNVVLNSAQKVRVDDLARHFGGGGHKFAAGFRLRDKSASNLAKKIINYIQESGILDSSEDKNK